MAKLTIAFTPPSPAPANGYRVRYRKVGTTSYNTISPYPTTSPVVITGLENGVNYEGTIEAACDGGLFSSVVAFSATTPHSFVQCGASLSNTYSGNNAYSYPAVYIDTFNPAITQLNISYDAVDRPNRFSVYDDSNNLVATSGWKGTATYSGPWGSSLSGAANGVLNITRSPGVTYYKLVIEAGPANLSNPINDGYSVGISCVSSGS